MNEVYEDAINYLKCYGEKNHSKIENIAYFLDCELKNYIQLQSNWNSLRKFFEMIPNYYMDKKSNNNGVYIQEGMERFRKLAIDKMNELEGIDKE